MCVKEEGSNSKKPEGSQDRGVKEEGSNSKKPEGSQDRGKSSI
ncbi:hypothetical protein Hanom_Chr08g00709951 [Helianthus anomalus]